MALHIIILAAGLGKRMNSNLPKVLHALAGKSLIQHVVETAEQLNPQTIHIIYGHGGEQIMASLSHHPLHWVHQSKQLGTGHAIMQALPFLPNDSQVLILSGDVPLIQANTLQKLVDCSLQNQSLTLLLATLANPYGLGRIIRNTDNSIIAIVEEKDASDKQKLINETYTGICCVNSNDLARWIPQLNNDNAQKEYYLTEIINMAVNEQMSICSQSALHVFEIQGVNNKLQLQQLERTWQHVQAEQLLLAGVGIADASRIDIRGQLICGKDVFIDVNCIFIGQVVLGDGCKVGPNCIINNTSIHAGTEILANSVLDYSKIGENCIIGPFARLRPGTQLAAHCKIGNFVETKNAVFAEGSKANHLSYLGDVTMGKKVNIGAGTITCNYDGANKHQTIIEDGVFVGSDTQFVAPITIGANATIGAGSTIRKNVPAGELTITESKQKTIFGWKRPIKSK